MMFRISQTPRRLFSQAVHETRDPGQPKSVRWSRLTRRSLFTIAAMLIFVVGCPMLAGAEDMRAHIAALRKKVPTFTIVEQAPFVVVGDEPAELVKLRATQIVKWAVELLKRDFFAKDPEEIIDVWLFTDKESYEKHTLELFGDKPSTPYGYYSQAHHALIMNIATGGGTLVHEIVHPYMRANPWRRAPIFDGRGADDGWPPERQLPRMPVVV